MAKRFTDTEKWDDPWFMDLPPEQKLWWVYLCDKCDHAGIWKVNMRLAKMRLGFNSDIDLPLFGGRIVKQSDEVWYIEKFVEFQYGQLNHANRVHASVIKRLEQSTTNKGLTSPLQGAKDKDKDKDKDKAKDQEKDKTLKTEGEIFPAIEKQRESGESKIAKKMAHAHNLVMRAFKVAKDIDPNDAAWDKVNYKRFARAAKDVLDIFAGDAERARKYVIFKGDELDEAGMKGWGLEAIARAAATDRRIINPREDENGRKDSEVGANRLDGRHRNFGTSRAGEIVGDALRQIPHDRGTALKAPDVVEERQDSGFDEEDIP